MQLLSHLLVMVLAAQSDLTHSFVNIPQAASFSSIKVFGVETVKINPRSDWQQLIATSSNQSPIELDVSDGRNLKVNVPPHALLIIHDFHLGKDVYMQGNRNIQLKPTGWHVTLVLPQNLDQTPALTQALKNVSAGTPRLDKLVSELGIDGFFLFEADLGYGSVPELPVKFMNWSPVYGTLGDTIIAWSETDPIVETDTRKARVPISGWSNCSVM